MNYVITNCFDNEAQALQGVCEDAFWGRSKFIMKQARFQDLDGHPTSLEQAYELAKKRMDRLCAFGFEHEWSDDATIYYATLQKTFIKVSDAWMFSALALFGKKEQLFPGMPQSVALEKEVWPVMQSTPEVRYQKFSEVYELFRVKPLIACINETSEVDWYKQAFRACVYQGKNNV